MRMIYFIVTSSNTNHNGTKVYDSVSEAYKTVKEEVDLPGIALVEKADESKGAVNDIILTIWFLGVSTIGVYVIIQKSFVECRQGCNVCVLLVESAGVVCYEMCSGRCRISL